ncbi:MAG: class I SAM-dependent methyltransferase [Methylovulum sp.]|nr:class I SAM-dependent methyltransferase [Methylovulum sp.]
MTTDTRSPKLSSRAKYNLIYLLFTLYELRYKQIVLNNCGYHPSGLQTENGLQLQFYLELLNKVELPTERPLKILDIGCGQAHGGIFLLQHYFAPQSQYTGIDISDVAIRYCKIKHRHLHNAEFVTSHNVPAFAEGTFDLVISIETTYPRHENNLQEISRLLKPAGMLLFAETYSKQEADNYDLKLLGSGFEIINKTNVTDNIVAAFVHDNERKLAYLKKLSWLPKKTLAFLGHYYGVIGSARFKNYQSGQRNGFIYAARKPSQACPGQTEH